ncbi:MAG: nitroreductase family protein, partial [Bacteroidales bacterium]
MKNHFKLIVIALMASTLSSCSTTDGVTADSAEKIILNNIMTRTSIRQYEDKAIDDEKIETMLRAAMAAPSAGNKQPWKFIVIKNKETLQAISNNFRPIKMAASAPLAIVVCGDLENTFAGDGIGYWIQDAS